MMNWLLTVGSFVFAAGQLLIQWLLASKRRIGWAVALVLQVPGVGYDVLTHQYGFALLAAWSVPVFVRGWRNFG